MAAAPPRRVIGGRWELDEQIGKGSFAVVWRAREVHAGARVAPDREATASPPEVPPVSPAGSRTPREGADPASSPVDATALADVVSSDENAETFSARDDAEKDDASETKWVAVKEICTARLNRKLLRSLESEIEVLRACRHENIIRLLDICKDEANRRVFLVLEHCAGGDLSEFLKRGGRVAETDARALARQIAGGLREMRSRNLIHRDLKPQNLLLAVSPRAESAPGRRRDEKNANLTRNVSEDVVLKIADFGFARYVHPSGLAETLCGSPLYMAPEILSYQKYDAKADLWSVGCILFELVCGAPPFAGANPMQLLRNITRGDARVPGRVASALSSECLDVMRGLLQKDPARRMSHEQFFEHPFLTGEGFEARVSRPNTRAEAPAPTLAASHSRDADSDSDASETSETRFASDPRAVALGTDGGSRGVLVGDARAGTDPPETPRAKRSVSPREGDKEKTFSLPAAAGRARDAAAAAGAWLGSSPLARRGATFSKLLSSSPLSAKKGACFSASPRVPPPPRSPADEADDADDADAEYVLVETRAFAARGNVASDGAPARERSGGVATRATSETRDARDVAEAATAATAATAVTESAGAPRRETGEARALPPALASAPPRRAARLERAARALRDAAGEAWDAGARMDAVALSLAATAALRRAAALAEAARRRAAAEGGGDDAEDVAEASRRLAAALEGATRRAERAASHIAAETAPPFLERALEKEKEETYGPRRDSTEKSEKAREALDVVVPDGMRATYAAALGWGRAAAAAELVGDAREAASTYARAHVLLSFLLSEGPGFCHDAFREDVADPEEVSEPLARVPAREGDDDGAPASAWWSAEERERVARFADAFAARRAACLERA